MPGPFAHHWTLDPGVDYLNHGSFGACPAVVLAEQGRMRSELEREPVDFLLRRLPELLESARSVLAEFVGVDAAGLVPVSNATTGVNTVLRALDLKPGDDVVVTDHAYAACRNALDEVARNRGVSVTVVRVRFPGTLPDELRDAVLRATSAKTRLALLDHVTSPTGVVFPIEELVRSLESRGVDCLVDGAHAPGMLPLKIRELGCAYYTGNCHKWICAPKGAGFLWVREDRRERIRPLVISHAATVIPEGRTRFLAEFEWTGTSDPTAFLCVPSAIRFMGGVLPGGWPALRAHNNGLALAARAALCDALDAEPPCPASMLGSLAAVPLPADWVLTGPASAGFDPLQDLLRSRHAIEVPVMRYPGSSLRFIRVSAQLYNTQDQYLRLAEVLKTERARSGGQD